MQIEVLIEPNPQQGFRATAPTHPDVTAEGPTEEAAVQTLLLGHVLQLSGCQNTLLDEQLTNELGGVPRQGCHFSPALE